MPSLPRLPTPKVNTTTNLISHERTIRDQQEKDTNCVVGCDTVWYLYSNGAALCGHPLHVFFIEEQAATQDKSARRASIGKLLKRCGLPLYSWVLPMPLRLLP